MMFVFLVTALAPSLCLALGLKVMFEAERAGVGCGRARFAFLRDVLGSKRIDESASPPATVPQPCASSRLGRVSGDPKLVASRKVESPDEELYGAEPRWQVFLQAFEATLRERLETHSETLPRPALFPCAWRGRAQYQVERVWRQMKKYS